MVNSIIYIVAFLLLTSSLVFYPKTEKRVGLIQECVMNLLFVLCYGVVGARIINILKFPVNLKSMGIIYMLPAIIIWICILCRKKIQKLTISKVEIISVIILSIVFLVIELKTFSYEMRAAYEYGTDAGNHLGMALNIVRTQRVSGMYFSALHNAMVIEIFQPFFEEVKWYKGFVLADTLHYYFEMLFYYAVIFSFAKKKITKYMAPVITLLIFAGYPLYGYMMGYVYWGWGSVLLLFIIYELEQISEQSSNNVWNVIKAIAGFVGVVFCYSLFAPLAVVFIGIWAVLEFRKRKMRLNGKLLGILAAVGTVCAIAAGYVYYTYFYIHGFGALESLKIHGGSFNPNIFTDFIWTLPVIILFFYSCIKKQTRPHMYGAAYLGACIFQLCLLGVWFAGFISDYYYFKFYYLLWCLTWVMVALAIEFIHVEKNEYKYIYSYVAVLGIIYIYCFGRIPERINSTGAGWLTNEESMGTHLYSVNVATLSEDFEDKKYSTEQLEICRYVIENLRDSGAYVPFAYWWDCGGENNWYVAITGMGSTRTSYFEEQQDVDWKSQLEELSYYVVLKKSELYKENIEYFETQNRIFENEEGFIVQVE